MAEKEPEKEKEENLTAKNSKSDEDKNAESESTGETSSYPRNVYDDPADEASGAASRSILDNFVKGLREVLPNLEEKEKPEKVFEELTLENVAKFIKDEKAKHIIVMTGAGLSTSAGIPDFRSPGSGLYHNLEKYNLPHPQAIFEIDFFHRNPEPFFTLARELYPGKFKPTPGHYFLRLLNEKGLLLRTYTQNIDTLEHVAGLPAEKVIEAHGTFFTNHCLGCKKQFSLEWMKEQVFSTNVPRCDACDKVVKPDIVFFGESLPKRFFTSAINDFPKCDLLIIMGTSLVVQPFAGLINKVGSTVPRLLINDTKVGQVGMMEKLLGLSGLDFDEETATRDIFCKDTCDNGSMQLAKLLGWEADLKELISREWKKIDSTRTKEEKGACSTHKKEAETDKQDALKL